MRADLRRQGISVYNMDLLIGATALVYDLTVVTNNTDTIGTSPACAWRTGSLPEAVQPMLEQWVIDKLSLLETETLVILADPQRLRGLRKASRA